MGRYDKIGIYSGGWKQPTQMYVWNGSSWVDFGTNDSDSTATAYVNNGGWQRITLNKVIRQTGTSYTFGGASTTWPSGLWAGTGNETYYASGDYSCWIPAGWAAWSALSSSLVSNRRSTGDWWTATSTNTSNVWRSFTWRRNTKHWVYNYVAYSAKTSLWAAQPSKFEFWNDDTKQFIGYYNFISAGASNAVFYVSGGINYKPNGGINQSRMNIYDGSGWKYANYSLRMADFHLETGTAYSTPTYTTYWE